MQNTNQEIQTQYDQTMIQTYQTDIIEESLKIMDNPDLKDLSFINTFNIKKLELQNCENIVPKLCSQTIKELHVVNYFYYPTEFQSVEDFQLNNLEVLVLLNRYQKEAKTLINEIIKFKFLKTLLLERWQVDISPLSQITSITSLSLTECDLVNVDSVKSLINLIELNLDGNDGIDITPLQYLTKLTILSLVSCQLVDLISLKSLNNLIELYLSDNSSIDITQVQHCSKLKKLMLNHCNLVKLDALQRLNNLLELQIHGNQVDITPLQFLTTLTKIGMQSCNLINIDALRPLINLQELSIDFNKIIYLQSLSGLKQLLNLGVYSNKIVDQHSLVQHPNFDKFILSGQDEPSEEELKMASKMKYINYPIIYLRKIQDEARHLKQQHIIIRKKISECLHKQYDKFVIFNAQIVTFFQNMNAFDGIQ
ncbi:leucine-rich_repeat domain-containing protein [Hexamita inflata]|uniref:Leucine-rich repeat domain-containing protein n=1 Tax=Hexamita inflata TaxID=28002 RepID=A0AA86RM44_9EUKA|nr:leucine-rich repeat domain-containing protein [Hexamita inflata]CAI9977091.1 leucine-rich repeat domain-containing protein [Hexamita inflata]